MATYSTSSSDSQTQQQERALRIARTREVITRLEESLSQTREMIELAKREARTLADRRVRYDISLTERAVLLSLWSKAEELVDIYINSVAGTEAQLADYRQRLAALEAEAGAEALIEDICQTCERPQTGCICE